MVSPILDLARVPFVQSQGHYPSVNLVSDLEVPLGVLSEKAPLSESHIDPVIHDLADMEQAVQWSEADEGTELQDLYDGPFDYLLELGAEDQASNLTY